MIYDFITKYFNKILTPNFFCNNLIILMQIINTETKDYNKD